MATDLGAEGILPPITNEPPKATPKEQIAPPTTEEAKKPGLLKRWLSGLGKKEEAQKFTEATAQIAEHRRSLSNITQNMENRVSTDAPAELRHLNSITELGANLTTEELQRKAILVAQNEADAEHRSLRVEDVPHVEQRLKEEQSAKATSPEPVGAGSKQ